MGRLDRLVTRELVGPFFLGVGLFGSLVFASLMLTRVTEWIVQGISPRLVSELALLFMPAILVKTFAMSGLLAALLAFGRLSSDSEVVAMRAAGASLFRVIRPVFVASVVVAIATFAINETVVPWASERANSLQLEVRRSADADRVSKSVMRSVKYKDGSVAMISGVDFSLAKQSLTKASMVIYDKNWEPKWWIQADEMRYFGPKDWRLSGRARMISGDGVDVIQLADGAWPEQIENPDITPRNLYAGFASDLDVFSMKQIKDEIHRLRTEYKPDERQIANLEFGYWNKIALPLNTVIFAMLGAPLGIRNQRTGIGSGFALSIALTFGYMMLANLMSVYSKGGAISPFVASFTPVALGLIAAAFAIWRKNK